VLGFDGGAVGTLQLNCLERLYERVVVTGRGSAVHVDAWRTVTAYLNGREGPELWEPDDQLPGDAVDPRHVHGFAGEVRHFVECARDGSRPEVTIDDGIAALRIEQAIKRSANERQPVEV
jgi:predicted dehydrogenase